MRYAFIKAAKLLKPTYDQTQMADRAKIGHAITLPRTVRFRFKFQTASSGNASLVIAIFSKTVLNCHILLSSLVRNSLHDTNRPKIRAGLSIVPVVPSEGAPRR